MQEVVWRDVIDDSGKSRESLGNSRREVQWRVGVAANGLHLENSVGCLC